MGTTCCGLTLFLSREHKKRAGARLRIPTLDLCAVHVLCVELGDDVLEALADSTEAFVEHLIDGLECLYTFLSFD